jgi:hypothetical protein
MIGLSRVHGPGYREAIAFAFDLIGPTLTQRLGHVQFVCGVDPVFTGDVRQTTTFDGRSYRDTACCAYGFHMPVPADRRVTTIMLPTMYPNYGTPHTIIHELGHALHETVRFEPTMTPVTDYAKSNRWEAFAEAFTAWVWPGNGYDRPAPQDAALFRSLIHP